VPNLTGVYYPGTAAMQNVKVTRKGKRGPVPARLFFILARKAPVAILFRRGPSDWVQIVRWCADTDIFEPGQWFHGRIYERRADLTPDGSLLVYFASKINKKSLRDEEYTYAWTAESKPPFLTALALWPKGDCWHGGGMFRDNCTLVLNHRANASAQHPAHRPEPLRVILKNNVCGEDDPIYSERLERDAWELKQCWEIENRGYPQMFRTLRPEIREKEARTGRHLIRLTRSITRLDYSEEFEFVDQDRGSTTTLQNAGWADWDQRGRLVFVCGGRVMAGSFEQGGTLVFNQLADLNSASPAPLPAPEWAANW